MSLLALTGTVFGRLTVVGDAPARIYQRPDGLRRIPRVKVVCVCGQTRTVFLSSLTSGHSTSCGRWCRREQEA